MTTADQVDDEEATFYDFSAHYLGPGNYTLWVWLAMWSSLLLLSLYAQHRSKSSRADHHWRSLALLPIYNGVIVLKLVAFTLTLFGRLAPLYYLGERSFFAWNLSIMFMTVYYFSDVPVLFCLWQHSVGRRAIVRWLQCSGMLCLPFVVVQLADCTCYTGDAVFHPPR